MMLVRAVKSFRNNMSKRRAIKYRAERVIFYIFLTLLLTFFPNPDLWSLSNLSQNTVV